MYCTEDSSLYSPEQPNDRPTGGYELENWMASEAQRRRRVAEEDFVFQVRLLCHVGGNI